MKTATVERLKFVIMADPSVLSDRSKPEEARPYEEDHLIEMGLLKRDLRELEVWGLAKRGYLTSGKGNKKCWVLYAQ